MARVGRLCRGLGSRCDYRYYDGLFYGRYQTDCPESGACIPIGFRFTILSGISYGFISALPAMVGIAISALTAYKLCEPLGDGYAIFGISMAAVGMLSIVGMIISNDAYGPIVDNARGLAEMGSLGDETIQIADELDSAGNTVKAITKGFAIGAAGLTVISLLGRLYV